jgi:hypothetical protein
MGRLGTATVSALANAKRSIDFGEHDFSDDPRGA